MAFKRPQAVPLLACSSRTLALPIEQRLNALHGPFLRPHGTGCRRHDVWRQHATNKVGRFLVTHLALRQFAHLPHEAIPLRHDDPELTFDLLYIECRPMRDLDGGLGVLQCQGQRVVAHDSDVRMQRRGRQSAIARRGQQQVAANHILSLANKLLAQSAVSPSIWRTRRCFHVHTDLSLLPRLISRTRPLARGGRGRHAPASERRESAADLDVEARQAVRRLAFDYQRATVDT